MDKCRKCGYLIVCYKKKIRSLGANWHHDCFTCSQCQRQLSVGQHSEFNHQLYCNRCFSNALVNDIHQYLAVNLSNNNGDDVAIEDMQCVVGIDNSIKQKMQAYNSYYHNDIHQYLAVNLSNNNGDDVAIEDMQCVVGIDNSIKQKMQAYNSYYHNDLHRQLTLRRFNNNTIVEGILKIYWDLQTPTHVLISEQYSNLVDFIKLNGTFEETDQFRPYLPTYGLVEDITVSSLLTTTQTISLILGKNKIVNQCYNFQLHLVYHHGYIRVLNDDEKPLLVRLQIGPSDSTCKMFIKEGLNNNDKQLLLSQEAAQWMSCSITELEMFVKQYNAEEQRQVEKIKTKYDEQRLSIIKQLKAMENL